MTLPAAATLDARQTQPTDSLSEDLRDANQQLLVAGIRALEQADIQVTLRAEAEAALAVRDEFLEIAAHELRTPITGIKTSAQLALRGLSESQPDNERIIKYVLGILVGVDRLGLLVNDLLDTSRMRGGELVLDPRPFDLGGLVGAVARRYPQEGDEQYQVTVDLPAEPLTVIADAGRLEQILDNLLGNSVKCSPDGGRIDVTLRSSLDGIVLTVTDAGIGLPPGTEEHIFEPFGRAPNANRLSLPGMGLGLHICKQIATAHGGRMWAESAGEGLGMTVGLWLPPA